ncbi:Zn-dependent peptidase ImmA, M78 family [Salegentibacter agarivorans]|uniref:Zn-dependent peptidase ImmA, M78 family n=1 Tax=Salegentibacter agarivorans TaxID=345907 RepID=A0A1I2NI71_9FLAO|nr:XRE family transcriptional regulator [Salegentibacter agarivorans]SFG03675.1 Zn-dependent peptidase ImmA, M78 family [Salegentibacter agarivorans]
MQAIFSKRLKSARILAGMSQDDLVKKIDKLVSKNAISKYEKGQMLPDSNVLIQLAKALNVKPDYFFRSYNVEIEKIEFRKKKKLGTKKLNAIQEQVKDMVERYLELEQFLEIKSEFKNPVSDKIINDGDDVENAVNTLLTEWKLGFNALPNVVEFLEEKEIKVVEIEAPPAFDGFSGWADKVYPVVVLNKNYSIERKRLTALHELGHLLLNFNTNLEHKDIEKLCFRFAGAMLIPKETFFKELGGKRTSISLNELINTKEEYGMSVQAIMRRAKDLEVITDYYYRGFCIKMVKNKEEEGLGKYVGIEKSNRFNQLLYRAASEDIISLSKAANLANLKLAAFRKEFIAL